MVRPLTLVDLTVVAGEVLADLETRLGQTGGHVELGALPTIDADPVQMHQLLQNLIGNALKFHRPEEKPLVQIEARMVTRPEEGIYKDLEVDPWCEITVADNGIGFDEKHVDLIFRPFQRLHGRQAYEGSGIGLAICRKIVQRHGGCLTARSRPGHGSTFIVALPVHQTVGETGQ